MKYMDLYGEAGRYFLRDWPKSKELKSAGLEILHLLLSPEWNELDGWNKQSELLLKTLKSLSHLSVRLARKCLYAVKNYFNSRYFNSLKKYVVYEYLWGSFKLTVESSLFKCLQQDLIALDTKLTASLEKTNTIKTKVGKLAAILLQTIYKSSRSASHKPFETFTLMLGLQISSAFALPTTRSSYDTSQVATISNCQQLQNIQTNLAGQYQLVGDIDCTATRTWNTGAGFNPVGKFTGILNGDGYSIGNLYVKRPNENFIGFFSIITNQARVMNVVLTNATVLGGHNDMVGGFVGWIQAAGIVSNCHVNAVVQAPSAQKVGGLVGVNDGTILESSSSGTVEGYGTTGGLLGANNAGTVIGSHSSSAVQSPFNDGYVGGLVGNNDRGIRNSYATGPVKGPYNVGGLVGWHRGNGVISNCYALGAASGPVAGGLVGTVDGQVTHAYSVGKVSTTGVAGGLVAKVNAGSVSNSYYDTTTSGQKDTGRGTPKTTADMTKQATYQGWNFASIWEINEGDTYPSIRSKPLQITFSEIKCSQTIRVPFPVAISTKDTNFNSRVNLFSKRGPVFPRWISMVNGKWFGNVTVYFIGKNTQLNLQWVDAHSTTHYGMSNAFDVVNDQGVIPDDATLMGVVIDSNQVAIANVTVKIYLSDPNKGAKPIYEITTNPDGQYQVMHVVPTELYLKIQKSGYQTIIQIVETEEGAQVSCNVELGLACTETDFENIEAPVLLVPGIMGSKESGWIYPRLSKKPTAWNAHKLSLLNPVNAAGWNTIKNLLKDQGYKEDCTLIDVPYHWTLSVPDIRDLYLKPWIDYIKKESGKDQVDIIAHSMGGLVARSYIQSFNYGNDVRKLAIVGTPNEGSSTLYFIWEGGDPIAGDKANGNPDGSWFGIAKYFYTNTLSYLGENILDEKLCDFNVGSWVPNSCDTEAVYHFLHEYGPAAHSLLATYDHALLDQNGRSTPIEKEENAFLKALNGKPCYQSGGCVDSSGVPYVFKAPAEAMSGDPSKVQTKLFVGIGEKTPASLVVKQQTLGGDLYQDGFPTHDYWTDFGDGSVLVSSVIFNGSFPVGQELPNIKKTGEHTELIGVFANELMEFVTGNVVKFVPSQRDNDMSASVLVIEVNGRVKPFLPDGANASSVHTTYGITYSQIALQDPGLGTYKVILNSTSHEDFELSVFYTNHNQTFVGSRVTGYYDQTLNTFTFVLNQVAGNYILEFDRSFYPPINLQMQNGTNQQMRLTWQDPTGDVEHDVDHYEIFWKREIDPYLAFFAKTISKMYQTNHTWAQAVMNTYVVRAFLKTAKSTFFSSSTWFFDNTTKAVGSARSAGLFSGSSKGGKNNIAPAYGLSP